MSERKVINKYIPPDFDPNDRSSIPRNPKRERTVRVMIPFSIRCSTCGEFIYKGRKFNARKETIYGEEYLGIPVFRFYIRCPWCSSEITYRTDPMNADYAVDHGATRNTEPWREQEKETAAARKKRQFEEEMNPLKAIENKTIDSKREIDMAEAIEDLRAAKADLERMESASLSVLTRPSNPRPLPEPVLPELSPEDKVKVREAFADRRPVYNAFPKQPVKSQTKRLQCSDLGIRLKPKQ